MRLELCVTLGLLLLSTHAIGQARKYTEQDLCVKNYVEKGNFFSPREYSTWQDFPSVNSANAFKRLYTDFAKGGLTITNSDKSVGVITAVAGNSGVSWNGTIEDLSGGGVKVTVTVNTPGKFLNTGRGMQAFMCDSMVAVEDK